MGSPELGSRGKVNQGLSLMASRLSGWMKAWFSTCELAMISFWNAPEPCPYMISSTWSTYGSWKVGRQYARWSHTFEPVRRLRFRQSSHVNWKFTCLTTGSPSISRLKKASHGDAV